MTRRLLLACLLLASLAFPLAAQQLRSDIVVDSVIAESMRHIGTPYRYGGSSPRGFDCAGFTRYIYGLFEVQLPHSSAAQYPVGKPVEQGQWQVGDLVFFTGRAIRKHIGHVGIVTGVDSSGFSFIHASVGHGIRVSHSKESYYVRRYVGACRLLEDRVPSLSPDPVPPPPAVEPSPLPPPSDTTFTLALVGDIMLATDFPSSMLPLDGGRHLFDHVAPLLREADLAMGNLEGVICDTLPPCRKKEGQYLHAFRTPPSFAPLLAEAGFDFLSLANNHSNDFGTSGLHQTMALLDSLGIRYAGVKNLCRTALVKVKGTLFGIAAFGHNGHTLKMSDTSLVNLTLETLRASCDIMIVTFHGGAEGTAYQHLPDSMETFLGEHRGHLRRFARRCVDRGADLVFGHGPHVPRAMEAYRGRLIAYSLGNFCTPTGFSLAGPAAYAPLLSVRIGRSGLLLDGRIHSFVQSYRRGPRPDPKHQAAHLIRSLSEEDFERQSLVFDDEGAFRPLLHR